MVTINTIILFSVALAVIFAAAFFVAIRKARQMRDYMDLSLRSARAVSSSLRADLEAADEKMEAARKEKDELMTMANELNNQKADLLVAINAKNDRIDRLKEENSALALELEGVKKDLEDIRSRIVVVGRTYGKKLAPSRKLAYLASELSDYAIILDDSVSIMVVKK